MTKDTNTGDINSGNWNSGHSNSGNWNSGHWNSGHWNSGDRNSGSSNSGSCNSGSSNSGSSNSGSCNSGYNNSGFSNSGDRNSGSNNSGSSNSGDRNSGSFNRDEPKMRLFEKELDMTVSEFYKSHDLYINIPLNRWVYESDMTDKEKKEVEGWKTMGGYLKTLEYKEAHRIWWNENPEDHKRFLDLPGFDWEIFTEITGIAQETEEDKEDPRKTIIVDGVIYVAKSSND